MRVLIAHFYNEEYLLPWWLNHHKNLFDYGILIDHNSTDNSRQIIQSLVPDWRIVNTRLTEFDAYLTDLEVMSYENELPKNCWKITLNITEFLLPVKPLSEIENFISKKDLVGFACTGYICVDNNPNFEPSYNDNLVNVKNYGFNENNFLDVNERMKLGLGPIIYRNRFYHKHSVGMYFPGRHASFHPHSKFRTTDLLVVNYGFSPWNENLIKRKSQIKNKISLSDKKYDFGVQHNRSKDELIKAYNILLTISYNLLEDDNFSKSLIYLSNK